MKRRKTRSPKKPTIRTKRPLAPFDPKQLQELSERVETRQLRSEDYKTFRASVDSQAYLADLLKQKNISIAHLKQLVFGASTEKTDAVLGNAADPEMPSPADENEPGETTTDEAAPTPRKGHGRNGVDAYHGAEKIPVPHESLQPGDSCPECEEGTLYAAPPGVMIRFTGQAPVGAKVYQLEKLRCNLCGKVFTAQSPPDVNSQRDYDVTVGGMIILLKYGCGLPFNRLQGLQGNIGIPLPASTQWGIIFPIKKMFEPIFDELIRQE